jgi:DNA-binding NarL/FixJ family response regulator
VCPRPSYASSNGLVVRGRRSLGAFGRIYVPSSVAEADDGDALGHFSGEASPTPSIEGAIFELTKRQREVLSLLARGRSNKKIACALDIAEATMKIHMAALLRTLGVRNCTEAAYKVGNLVISTELGSAELIPGIDGPASFELTGVGSMSRADE